MKNKKEDSELEVGDDISKYGEFIPTRFAWISLGYQKENAKRLQNITNKEKNKKLNNNTNHWFGILEVLLSNKKCGFFINPHFFTWKQYKTMIK